MTWKTIWKYEELKNFRREQDQKVGDSRIWNKKIIEQDSGESIAKQEGHKLFKFGEGEQLKS